MTTNHSIVKPRGRVRSCTMCRQVKLRCDALIKFPAACSRCELQELDCKIDSNFKRVSVRSRLDEILRQMNNKQPNAGPLTPESFSKYPRLPSSNNECYTSPGISPSGKDWMLLTNMEVDGGERWSLGNAELSFADVSELLNFYSEYYYEHLPILDRITSISALHQLNALLFWTIIRVSSYRHPRYTGTFTLSAQAYQSLLCATICNPINDFRTVQALIILCYWPNSGERQSQDPSWQYCGVVLNSAMQMGMDQPCHERVNAGFGGRSNVHQMSTYSRQMTWLACFCISTSLATWLGISPHVSSAVQLKAIGQMAKDPGIPPYFAAQVAIQRQTVIYSTGLAGDVDSSTGATLLGFYNAELDTISATYHGSWTAKLEIQLLAAKLYLFSLCYTNAHKRNTQSRDIEESTAVNSDKILIQRGLPFAVSLIHNMSKLLAEYSTVLQGPGDVSSMIHLPKQYFRLTMFAVCFLMKFLSANPRAAQELRETAISHIIKAHRLFSSFPAFRDLARTAEVIEIMVNGLKSEGDDHQASIRARFGASMLYELVKDFQVSISETASTTTAPQTDQGTDGRGKHAVANDISSLGHNPGPMAALPPAWNPLDVYNNFANPQLSREDDLGNMQWISDDIYFPILGMSSG